MPATEQLHAIAQAGEILIAVETLKLAGQLILAAIAGAFLLMLVEQVDWPKKKRRQPPKPPTR